MNLESQISQMDDPQEFVRLCNTVYSAKYENDFQVIDGTRSDQGNDGYVIAEKRLLAIYCPIKPEQRTDKDFLRKITVDMRKAKVLKESGQYDIANWTFVTPRKLSNTVVAELRKLGAELGINANHIDATFIAIELMRHPSLLPTFPQFHLPQIDEKLTEILSALQREDPLFSDPAESKLDHGHIYGDRSDSNNDLKSVVALRESMPTSESKSELRKYFYKSTDAVVQINALLGVLELFDPPGDDIDDLVTLCDQGIRITVDNLSDLGAKAYFLGQKGFLLSFQFSDISLRTGFEAAMSNAVGMQLHAGRDFANTVEHLAQLHKGFTSAFSEAIELAQSNKDAKILADVLVFIGNAAGMRYIHENALGYIDQAAADKRICKTALLTAKDICSQLGYEWGITNALMNLANQIRFFGEEAEALQLAKEVIARAESHGDKILLAKANALQETLETGYMPDYLAGEKREWM